MSTIDLGGGRLMPRVDAYHRVYLICLADELSERFLHRTGSEYWLRLWGRAMSKEASS